MHPPIVDDSDLYWQTPLSDRLGPLVRWIIVGVILILLVTQRLRSVGDRSSAHMVMALLWLMVTAVGAMLALNLRSAFIFGATGVTSRQWPGSQTLDYADMASCTVHQEQVRSFGGRGGGRTLNGLRIVFQPTRSDLQPLSLFIDDREPLDPRIITRLRGVPALDPHALKVLDLAKRGREW